MTAIVIYTGTSISWQDSKKLLKADYRPPVKRNDINILLDKENPDIIGIIDGIFFDRAAVAHREIIRALNAGITVVGGSSMGALRASELDSYGMIGIGQIYAWYRDGVIESDDEVAVTFHPESLAPVAVPLVNIRTTLDRAVKEGIVDSQEGSKLLEEARSLYYPDRTYQAIVKKAVESGTIDASRRDALVDYLINNEVDIKRNDAVLVIEKIRELAESL